MGNRYSRYMAVSTAWVVAVGAVCYFGGLKTASAAGAQEQRPSSFNSGQVRPAEDPAKVIHGKALYAINCQACHGQDLRGGDMGGPNLLRSQVALTDQHGELIVPIIQGSRMSQGMPNIGLNDEDAGAVAAYIRSVIGTIGSQGTPPGEKDKPKLNIVVGDATRGKEYFAAHCASCHSATGDLKTIATTYPEPMQLQAAWVAGGGRNRSAVRKAPTVDVTVAQGKKISGELVRIDDFLVTLKQSDGTQRTFARKGAMPVVVVHDPMQAHRDMMPRYTDNDIHDVTAYLVTLK
ncbi:c-type cytochrome [Edaphobacter flagellatus]|uniref:c-type cytochrome n=1 Tax=Edaphobacter flagellatus TaxID=1933044 RepID=UPI0021B297FD|nr:c-type cytochrome [Edaphobacter flagellatus]